MTLSVTVLLFPTASSLIRASIGPVRMRPGRAPAPVSFSTPTDTVIPRTTKGPRSVIFARILIGVPGELVDGMLRIVTCSVVRGEPTALAAATNSTTTTSGMSRHTRTGATITPRCPHLGVYLYPCTKKAIAAGLKRGANKIPGALIDGFRCAGRWAFAVVPDGADDVPALFRAQGTRWVTVDR